MIPANELQVAVDDHGSIDRAAKSFGIPRDQFREMCRQAGVRVGAGTADYVMPPASSFVKWGEGRAELVRPAATGSSESVVFLSDIHFPYQEDALLHAALDLIEKLKPNRVVINGDTNDFFQLSRFNRAKRGYDDLKDEIQQGNDFRRWLRRSAPDAVIDENEGNHCSRISTYLANEAPAMRSLADDLHEIAFESRKHDISWHPGCGFLLRPHFLVKHGTLVRGEAGATAKAELALAGVSGISGHTHRLATYRKVGYSHRQWTEQGCMCRVDPDYVVGAPNWQQGIVVGEFSTKSDAFVTTEVPFVDGRLVYGGERF